MSRGVNVTLESVLTCPHCGFSAQGWQCNACYRVSDQSERERCLSNANMSYEDYRRKSEGPKRD